MMTQDERRALWIAGRKYGVEELAKELGVGVKDLLNVARGMYKPEVEELVKAHWGLIREILFGEMGVSRNDR